MDWAVCCCQRFPNGAIEIRNLETDKSFKVNGHHLKPFIDASDIGIVEEIHLLNLGSI